MNRIYKFMNGRYGPDELYLFLFKIYLIILITNLFLNSKILTYLELITIIIIFFRFFSKNISKRTKENKTYLKYKNKVYSFFKEKQKKIKKNNNYIYKKCHKRLKVLCLRSEKIEVITKKKGR